MKQILLAMTVVLARCSDPTLDVKVGPKNEPDDCEHDWGKWKSFSRNPAWTTTIWMDEDREFAKVAYNRKIEAERGEPLTPWPVRTPQYIQTTGEMVVAYQTRTCSKCGKLQRN